MLKKHICFLILSSATRLYPSLLALVSLSPFFLNTQSVLIGQLIHAWVSTANRWPSEAFGDTRTSLGKNLFGVFSCEHTEQTCEVWDGWLSAVGAIGFSDWLCASCMTILIGSVLANQRGVWEGRNIVCALFFYALCSVIFCFHILEYWHKTSATCR